MSSLFEMFPGCLINLAVGTSLKKDHLTKGWSDFIQKNDKGLGSRSRYYFQKEVNNQWRK
jgi:hypothetical protein